MVTRQKELFWALPSAKSEPAKETGRQEVQIDLLATKTGVDGLQVRLLARAHNASAPAPPLLCVTHTPLAGLTPSPTPQARLLSL